MTKKKVLVTVKTYPVPSRTYRELVCTAGVLEDGTFIRLYPIDYRYRNPEQQYDKYQWIEVEVEKHEGDKRKESYRPDIDSIKPLEKVGTEDNWYKRKEIVLQNVSQSIEELDDKREQDHTSLGIIKPKEVTDLVIEPDKEEWDAKKKKVLQQKRLFGPDNKPLDKIPFKFRYEFTCNDPRCNGHKMAIEDWEVGQLYRNELRRLGDKQEAAKSTKHKFFDILCGEDKETYFFVGTTTPIELG